MSIRNTSCYLRCSPRKYPQTSTISNLCKQPPLYTVTSSHVYYLLMIPSACNLYIHPLIVILCKRDLQNLFHWSKYWNLQFNKRKCVLLRFSAKCPLTSYNYTIGDNPIATTEHHKDLGVIMSNNLSWAEHLKFISSRAYKLLGLVRRSLSRSHHPNIKKILYISLIHAVSTYILFTSLETSPSKAYYVP